MMLLADESVDRPIVERLRKDGHNTLYIAELSPGLTDDQVLQEANDRNALLLTEDKDFGELVYRLGRIHAGVLLIRLAGAPPSSKAETVAKVLQDHATELASAFSVISPAAVRIRKPFWRQFSYERQLEIFRRTFQRVPANDDELEAFVEGYIREVYNSGGDEL